MKNQKCSFKYLKYVIFGRGILCKDTPMNMSAHEKAAKSDGRTKKKIRCGESHPPAASKTYQIVELIIFLTHLEPTLESLKYFTLKKGT